MSMDEEKQEGQTLAEGQGEQISAAQEEWDVDEDQAALEETGESVEDRVDAAIQKLVMDTVGDIPDSSDNPFYEEYEDEDDEDDDEEDDDDYEYEGRGKKIALIVGGVLLLCALIVGGAFYVRRALYFQKHFFNGTVINGINCADRTVDEVEKEIEQKAEKYSLTIQFRDKSTALVEGQDIDYDYVPDGSVQQIMNKQKYLAWFLENSKKSDHEVQVNLRFSQEKLTEILNGLEQFQVGEMEAPADAYLDFQNAKFVIVEEVEGSEFDVKAAKELIAQAVSEGRTEIDLMEEGVYAQPAVTKDDEELNAQMNQLNEYVSANITHQLPNGSTQVLDGTILKDWL